MNLAFLACTYSFYRFSGSGSLAVPTSLYNKAVPFGNGKNKLPLCVSISVPLFLVIVFGVYMISNSVVYLGGTISVDFPLK
jgi:hypothetical protein